MRSPLSHFAHYFKYIPLPEAVLAKALETKGTYVFSHSPQP